MAPAPTPDVGSLVVFRYPLALRLVALGGTVILAAMALGCLALSALLLAVGNFGLGALSLGLGCFMAGLTGWGGRELPCRLGLKVELGPERLELRLPAGRSLLHVPRPQRLAFAYPEIAAIETRFEAYSTLGVGALNRVYVLLPRVGEPVFLFEDRGEASRGVGFGFRPEWRLFKPLVETIAARAGIPVRDFGMQSGSGLATWGGRSPDWAAPARPLTQQLRLWGYPATVALLAGGAAGLAAVVVALLRL